MPLILNCFRCCLIFASLLIGHVGQVCAADLSDKSAAQLMNVLMTQLAQAKHIKTQFTEVKHIKVLDSQVSSSGELLFQAPGKLEKRTVTPRAEILRIDGNTVAIEKGNFKRSMSLSEYPDIASMVQSLTATFRGDQFALEQFFNWAVTGSIDQWTLSLKPKSQKLFITLREIKLQGEGHYVKQVDTVLTDGDFSVMTLSKPVLLP
jgi:outer membrane lipoprotein-sorting protein